MGARIDSKEPEEPEEPPAIPEANHNYTRSHTLERQVELLQQEGDFDNFIRCSSFSSHHQLSVGLARTRSSTRTRRTRKASPSRIRKEVLPAANPCPHLADALRPESFSTAAPCAAATPRPGGACTPCLRSCRRARLPHPTSWGVRRRG